LFVLNTVIIFRVDFGWYFLLRDKELSLCHKLKFSNPYIYGTWFWGLLIFQIWCHKIHSLKYLRSTTFGCTIIGMNSNLILETWFVDFIHHIFYLNSLLFYVYLYIFISDTNCFVWPLGIIKNLSLKFFIFIKFLKST